MHRGKKLLLFCASLFLLVIISIISFSSGVNAATLTVTNLNDSGPGSLRQAIADSLEGDIIAFDNGLTGTLTLLSTIEIDKSLTINGPGKDIVTISGNRQVRIFNLISDDEFSINNLTLTQGLGGGGAIQAAGLGTGEISLNIDSIKFIDNSTCPIPVDEEDICYSNSSGGAVYMYGSINISNSDFINNSTATQAESFGGAVYTIFGNANITNTNFEGNTSYFGGALYIDGNIANIGNVDFIDNYAEYSGGAIVANGSAIIDSSYFFNNTAQSGDGGAMWIPSPPAPNYHTYINNTTLEYNNSNAKGGAISGSDFHLEITNSTLNNNVSGSKGGAINYDVSTCSPYPNIERNFILANSTLAYNEANEGGGVYYKVYKYACSTPVLHTSKIINSTIASNISDLGGGVFTEFYTNVPRAEIIRLEVQNTILANNIGGNCADIDTPILGNMYSLQYPGNECGDLQESDPYLFPLADNGGPTKTMMPDIDSGVLNSGDNSICSQDPINNLDQRGVERPQDSNSGGVGWNCDIGAVEVRRSDLNYPPYLFEFLFNPASGAVDEGYTIEVTANFIDPDNDPLVYDWDLDSDGIFEIQNQQTVTVSAENIEGPTYISAGVRATDPKGAFEESGTPIRVNDIHPGEWGPMSNVNAPEGTRGQAEVWTGTEMIVWGGENVSGNCSLNTGSRYNPTTNTWTPMSNSNAPTPRRYHSAIWTGTEMIIWGGEQCNWGPTWNTGAKYNPVTDTWTPISTVNAPSPRLFHSVVWTGTEMIVWGGDQISPGVSSTDTGAKYNPATDTWTAITSVGAPSPRNQATAIWTGTEMIIWGGADDCCNTGNDVASGAKYNVVTDAWTAMPIVTSAWGFFSHSVVWTGDKMIIWGGLTINEKYAAKTYIYDPVSNTFEEGVSDPHNGSPSERGTHEAVWMDGEMFVWGGYEGGVSFLNTGAIYDPTTHTWRSTSLIGAPSKRNWASTVWTGESVLVWGGFNNDGTEYFLNDGAIFYPEGIINTPPTVDAGGPYYVNEGDLVSLTATATDPENDELTYKWDLDSDGNFETSGQIVDFDSDNLNPGTYIVKARATDPGNLFDEAEAEVIINDIPTVDDFVALGSLGIWLKQGTIVNSGDIGASQQATSFLDSGVEASIGNNVSIVNPESDLYADSIWLKSGSEVNRAYYNTKSGSGSILNGDFTPIDLPVVEVIPTTPEFNAGTTDIEVLAGTSQTIDAGNFDDLIVRHNATVTFTGGIYNFDSWDIRQDVNLYFTAQTEIRIADKLGSDSGVELKPAIGSGLDASDIIFYVTGVNGSSGNIGATPKAAQFGTGTVMEANVYVPNGTLFIKANSIATGSFIGKWVTIGEDVNLTLDSAF